MRRSEELISQILREKAKIEDKHQTPRVILLGSEVYFVLEKDWIKSYYILEKNCTCIGSIFDGILLGLFVIKVDTINGFEVR